MQSGAKHVPDRGTAVIAMDDEQLKRLVNDNDNIMHKTMRCTAFHAMNIDNNNFFAIFLPDWDPVKVVFFKNKA